MEITLPKKKVDAFVEGMEQLSKKFNNVYVKGKLEDYAKLDIVEGNLELTFIKPVSEMVRIACILLFVDTLL